MGAPQYFIDGYPLDAVTSATYSHDSDVTDEPVEAGSNVTDNAKKRPLVLTLECCVSNTPIGSIAELRDPTVVPGDDARARLLAIQDAGEPVVVETPRGRFESMELQNVGEPVSPTDGDTFKFSATFKQLRIVSNERTTVRTATAGSKKKRNRGVKNPKAAALEGVAVSGTAVVADGYSSSWAGRALDNAGVTNNARLEDDLNGTSIARSYDAASKW